MANEIEQFAQQLATKYGIDYPTLHRVIAGEGGFSDPYQRSLLAAPGSQVGGGTESSYGPLQLYISGRGKGMGDAALAAGIDPRTDWRGGMEFGAQQIARKGWGDWMGAKAAGITGMEGVGGRPGMNLNYVPGQSLPTTPIDTAAAPVAPPVPTGPPSLMDTITSLTAKPGENGTGVSQLGSLANAMSPDGGQQQQSPQILPTNALAASENTDAARIASAQALMAQLMAKRRGVPGMNLGMLG